MPHPDGRVEAQLQRVLSLYAAIERTEDRIGDIRYEQRALDAKIRLGFQREEQAAMLRRERTQLEAFITDKHESVARLMADLGEDATFLSGF
jgi:predicted RNase H-like nuclease (RuvC/YqgF family)